MNRIYNARVPEGAKNLSVATATQMDSQHLFFVHGLLENGRWNDV